MDWITWLFPRCIWFIAVSMSSVQWCLVHVESNSVLLPRCSSGVALKIFRTLSRKGNNLTVNQVITKQKYFELSNGYKGETRWDLQAMWCSRKTFLMGSSHVTYTLRCWKCRDYKKVKTIYKLAVYGQDEDVMMEINISSIDCYDKNMNIDEYIGFKKPENGVHKIIVLGKGSCDQYEMSDTIQGARRTACQMPLPTDSWGQSWPVPSITGDESTQIIARPALNF